jgi:hypothetical protein
MSVSPPSIQFYEGEIMNIRKFAPKAALLAALTLFGTVTFAQDTKTVEAGLTSVKLSATFTSALESLAVTPGTVAPTRLRDGVATFPISGGAIDLDTAAGNILHVGGLTLTDGSTEVRLQSFIIDTTATPPVLTGIVIANNTLVGRLPLFQLTLPSGFTVPLKPKDGFILQLQGVALTLTSQAATALNGVFGLTGGNAIPAALPIGTASVFSFVCSHKE